jgi:hypothetical protein
VKLGRSATLPAPRGRRVASYRGQVGRREFLRDLRDVLLKARPSLAGEDEDVLLELNYFVWTPAMGKRKHSGDSNYCYFPARELEARLRRGGFNRLNAKHRIFEILEASPSGTPGRGLARGYKLAPDIQAAVSEYLRRIDERLPKVISRDGARILTPPNAVASKNSDGRQPKAFAGAPIAQSVPVDLRRLLTLAAHLRRYLSTEGRWVAGTLVPFSNEELARISHRETTLTRLIGLCNSNLGRGTHIPHRYEEIPCGRLVATGVSLQNARAEIRATALHGCWEYDFANCHYSVIQQMAERLGVDLPEVRWYLENKLAVRESLANRIGVDPDSAKKVLISGPIYGAHSTLWSAAAIPQLIGTKAASKLYADPQYQALKADVARARKAILKHARVENDRLFNAVGSSIPIYKTARGAKKPQRETPAALFSHLVLGVEALLLRSIIDAFPDDVLLPMHDGWVSGRELDRDDLARTIYAKTGFRMQLDVERIEASSEVGLEKLSDPQVPE